MQILTGDADAPLTPLQGRKVAVIGYGNQGHAHALNLRDSGIDVVVGVRAGSAGASRARADGWSPRTIAGASAEGDLIVVALPDEVQPTVYAESIAPALREGVVVGFLHGFNIRYRMIEAGPDIGVVMVAPKGPGATLRALFLEGRGLPALFAVEQDPLLTADAIGLAWANGIGAARAVIIRTTFSDETETDLFGEQSVLCGGLYELIRVAFETLVEAGYPAPLAYLECCHEVKQIADLVYARGFAATFEAISSTAEFGAFRTGPVLIDESVRQRMKTVLAAIRDGSFAAALQEDYAKGFPWFEAERAGQREHPLEPAGRIVRQWMPWLEEKAGTGKPDHA